MLPVKYDTYPVEDIIMVVAIQWPSYYSTLFSNIISYNYIPAKKIISEEVEDAAILSSTSPKKILEWPSMRSGDGLALLNST